VADTVRVPDTVGMAIVAGTAIAVGTMVAAMAGGARTMVAITAGRTVVYTITNSPLARRRKFAKMDDVLGRVRHFFYLFISCGQLQFRHAHFAIFKNF
jgi:membrane-bound ClpP family serine protease